MEKKNEKEDCKSIKQKKWNQSSGVGWNLKKKKRKMKRFPLFPTRTTVAVGDEWINETMTYKKAQRNKPNANQQSN